MTPTLCAASSARHTCWMMSTASSGATFAFSRMRRAQVLALDELHGDELDALGFRQVVDADHVAVRDLVGEEAVPA